MGILNKMFGKKENDSVKSFQGAPALGFQFLDDNITPNRWYNVSEYAVNGNEAFGDKKYQECIDCFTKEFFSYGENALLLSIRAKAFAHLQKYEEALSDVDKVLSEFPDHRSANYTKGWVLLEKGDFNGAIAIATKGLKSNPDFVDLHFLLYNCYLKAGNKVKAMQHLAKGKGVTLKREIVDYNKDLQMRSTPLRQDEISEIGKDYKQIYCVIFVNRKQLDAMSKERQNEILRNAFNEGFAAIIKDQPREFFDLLKKQNGRGELIPCDTDKLVIEKRQVRKAVEFFYPASSKSYNDSFFATYFYNKFIFDVSDEVSIALNLPFEISAFMKFEK